MKRYKKRDNQRINQIIMGSFLAFLMVFSIVGYVFNYRDTSSGNYEFNGQKYDIDVENNVLITKIDKKQVVFYNYPDSISPLSEQAVSDLLSAKQPGPIITFDPSIQENLPFIDQIRAELDTFFLEKGVFLSAGVYPEAKAPYTNFPLIDCVNASQGSPVIKFINSSDTEVEYENNCLLLKGSGYGMLELRDTLLYSLYGLV